VDDHDTQPMPGSDSLSPGEQCPLRLLEYSISEEIHAQSTNNINIYISCFAILFSARSPKRSPTVDKDTMEQNFVKKMDALTAIKAANWLQVYAVKKQLQPWIMRTISVTNNWFISFT